MEEMVANLFLCTLQTDGTIIFANAGWLALASLKIGDHFESVLHPGDRDTFWSALKDIHSKAGQSTHALLALRDTRDGRKVLHWIFTASSKSPNTVHGIGVDVSSWANTLQRAEQKAALFSSIVERHAEWISRMDAEGNLTFANAPLREFLDVDRPDLPVSLWKFVPERYHPVLRAYFDALIPGVPQARPEHSVCTRSGEEVWYWWIDTRYAGEGGQPDYIQSVGQEITELHHTKVLLQHTERRHRHMLDNLQDIFLILDLQGVIQETFRSMQYLLGYDELEVLDRHFSYFIHPEDLSQTQSYWEQWAAHPGNSSVPDDFACRVRHASGSWIWMDIRGVHVPEENVFYVFGRDITARVLAERAVASVHERQEHILNHTGIGVWEADPERNTITLYHPVHEILGLAVKTPIPLEAWLSVIHPEDIGEFRRLIKLTIHHDAPFEMAYRVLLPTGETLWYHSRAIRQRPKEERGMGLLLGTTQDMTEQHKMTVAMQHQVRRQSTISTISALCAQASPEALDGAIELSISLCASLFSADRSYIFLFSSDYQYADNVYEWCAPGVSSQRMRLQHVPVHHFASSHTPILEGEAIVIDNVASQLEDGDPLKEELLLQEVQSIVILPISASGKIQGYIGFDAVRRQIHWTVEQRQFLSIVGEIIGGALLQRDTLRALKLREQLLSAIASSTEALLSSPDVRQVLRESLPAFGECTLVDRVYVFENYFDPEYKEVCTRQVAEWCSPRAIPQIDNPTLLRLPHREIPDFVAPLQSGKPFVAQVRALPEGGLKEILDSQDIKSLLVLPIFIKDEFWGFLGFDDCTNEREWTDAEVNLLHAFAISVASALERNRTTEHLKQSNLILATQNDKLLQFTHIVSHNLRSQTSNLSMVRDALYSAHTREEFEEFFEMLHETSLKMHETVETLNVITTMRSGLRPDLSHVALRASFDRLTQSLHYEITTLNAHIEVNIPETLTIFHVQSWVDSILFHLLSNALRYRSPERAPVLQISAEQRPNGIELKIADNGLGIDLIRHGHKIFGLFKTFHNNPDARGLGLYLVRNQVESLGGTISVQSVPGRGTTFTLFFHEQPEARISD